MKSVWMNEKQKEYQRLNQNIECEILIVGAGLSGLLCAYQLQDKYEKIVIIESDFIASGASGRNTGKVTSLHGTNFHQILKKHGKEKACVYFEENAKAIHEYKKIIEKYQIECDWKEKTSLVGCKSQVGLQEIEKEIEAYKRCEIPFEKVENESCLKGIRFHHQASFNPYKFAMHLAAHLKVEIFEKTPMMSIKNHVVTSGMFQIKYQHCILATQVMPFQFKPFYALTQPKQVFLAALTPSTKRNEMLWMKDEISKTKNDYEDFMLIGGYEHKLSEDSNLTWQKFKRDLVLEYPQNHVECTWSSQDYETVDYLPIVDAFEDFIAITGFNAWGNTNALVASKIVLDILNHHETPIRKLFSINRWSLYLNTKIMKENIQVAQSFMESKMETSMMNIPNDKKALSIQMDGHPYGIYRESDTLYIVDILCTHLGCTLKFNEHDCCWDCPCHGSRFSIHGEIIKGPAIEKIYACEIKLNDLKKKK